MSSQVGGIARAPVWGANSFLTIIAEVATTIPYIISYKFITRVCATAMMAPPPQPAGHVLHVVCRQVTFSVVE